MDARTWNELINNLPGAHLMQTWEWAAIKQAYGWQMIPQAWKNTAGKPVSACMTLERAALPVPFLPVRVLYAPRGPLLDWTDPSERKRVLNELENLARQRRAIFIKVDPGVVVGRGEPGSADEQPDAAGLAVETELRGRGWQYSPEQVQFRNTVVVDLQRDEETLLARMKQKTRYNIRLAEKKGVRVRLAADEELPAMYRMYAETSVRDGFVIRPEAYYLQVWRSFQRAGMAVPLVAEVEGELVAGLVLLHFARRGLYMYGMSRQAHREKMPNYLLQWEAMRRAKALGCTSYDLWGAPDTFDESDTMWGVYRFKEGLGGEVVRTLGAWDFPIRPQLYSLYTRTLPRLLDWMRRRGQQRTQQEVTG